MNIIIVVLGLAILLVLTLKKVNVPIAALVSVVFIIAFSGLPILKTINNAYLTGFTNFLQSAWLMLLLGAILSKIMDVSGAARSIAQLIIKGFGEKRAIPAIVISGGLLTFGGVQAMVACFALYPIALAIFRNSNLPRYLLPATIGTGLFTWVYMIPGNPQIVNMIPTKYLGTNAMAAPAIGFIAAGSTLGLILLYFHFAVKKARKAGDGFIADEDTERTLKQSDELEKNGNLPNPWLSLVPLIAITITLDVFDQDISIALLVGIILCFVFFWKNIFKPDTQINKAIADAVNQAAVLAIVSSAIVGIGSVIQVTPGFKSVVKNIIKSSKTSGNPIVIFGLATAILCGLCASAMGGLSTTLAALAKPFLALGVNAEVLHRIGVIASTSMDCLPHSGGIVAVLTIAGVTYKEGYKHLFITCVLITSLVSILSVIIAMGLYPVQ